MTVALEQERDERILELIGSMPGCKIDDIVGKASDLTWNQVFAEIDRLSRTGRVLVTLHRRGEYMLTLPSHGVPEAYPRCDIAPSAANSATPAAAADSLVIRSRKGA